MRNYKKLICLILTLSIVFTTFTSFARESLPPYENMENVFRFDVGDFAAESESGDAEYDPDSDRINFLTTLGIWDDAEKLKSALVTVTELSVIMSNLKLGSDNALKGVYTIEDNVDNSKATYKNALEHLLGALGYSYRCAQYGNSPESLLIVASDIGLISEKPENIDAFITRAELAKLITKALTIDMCSMEYTSTGGYKYTIAEGRNLLNTVHGIYEIGGFVNAIPGLAVYGGTSCKEGYIQIDRRNVNTSGMDLSAFLGSRVTAYATLDEDINEFSIIYIDYAEDNQHIEIDFANIVDMDAQSITYIDENNVELEIAIDALSYVTENGDKLNNISEMSDYRNNEGKIIFTASERKGDIDTAIIYKYKYYVVSYVDSNNFKIGIQFNMEYDGNKYLQLNDKAVNVIIVDGAETDYSALAAGTTIRYFTCKATGYTEIIGQTKKTDGDVESIYDDTVTIGGVDFRHSKDLLNIIAEGKKPDTEIPAYDRVKDIELGLSTTFYVFDNILVGYTNTQTYQWGYLRSIKKSRTSIDPELTLRILNGNSDWIELKVTDKFELDGETGVTKEEFLSRVDNNIDIINNIVRYKVGKADELAALDTIEISQYEADSHEDVEHVYDYNYTFNWTGDFLQLKCPYMVSPNTVFFIIPAGEEDEKKFKATNVTGIPQLTATAANYLPMKFYTPDQFKKIGAAVCTKALDESSSGTSERKLFVENIRYTLIDADNMEFGYKIIGKTLNTDTKGTYGNVAQFSVNVSEEFFDKNDVSPGDSEYDEKLKIEVGDIISFSSSQGIITTWNMFLKQGKVPPIAAETEDPDDLDFNQDSTTGMTGPCIIKAVDTIGQYMVAEFDGVEYPVLSRCKIIVDVENKKFELVTIADFQPGDRAYMTVNYGRAALVVKNK